MLIGAQLTTARQRSEELASEYQQSLRHESDEALARRRADAAVDVLAKRGLLEQIQRDKPVESASGMETRISRLDKAKQQFNADLIDK